MGDKPPTEKTASALVNELASRCIGFHFSNEKAYGKTTRAYLLKTSSHAAGLKRLVDQGAAKGIYDIGRPDRVNYAETIFLRLLFDHCQRKAGGTSIGVQSSFLLPLSPFTVLVKGSMVNSIATVCTVNNIIAKTGAFYLMENEIIGAMIAATKRVGYESRPRTAASAIRNSDIGARLSRTPTLLNFFTMTGFQHSAPMARAVLNVWVAHSTLKEGYADAGARFRDSTSRKLAQSAYDDALYCALYTIMH